MEDSYIANLDINNDGISLFAIFDGHGGPEVARFVQANFTKCLVSCSAYRRRDYKQALQYTFLKMDRMLKSSKGQKELMTYMDLDTEEN